MPTRLLRSSAVLGLLALCAVAGRAPMPAETAGQADPTLARSDCEADFDPDTVAAGTVEESVRATTSEPVGELTDVHADPESGLDIIWIHHGEDGPAEARLRVSAIRADLGEWTVTLRGDAATCEGRIRVVDGRVEER